MTLRDADRSDAFAWTARGHTHAAPPSFDGRKAFPVHDGATAAPETYIVIEDEDFRTLHPTRGPPARH
ncbi:MAG: hypothetical protein IPK16_03435 [Anaerolineales bacterium]|nr:hypothetical protein [Anaerolineales bacterium]